MAQPLHCCDRIRVVEYRGSGHEDVCSGVGSGRRVLRTDPSIDLDLDLQASPINEMPGCLDLGQDPRDELLTPKAGVDRHDEQHVTQLEIRNDRIEGRRRRQHQAEVESRLARGLGGPRRIGVHLDVHRHEIGPRNAQGSKQADGVRHHEVTVEPQFGGCTQGADHRHPEGQVRDEMSIHDVDVQEVDIWLHARHLIGEVGEIGGQQRRCDLDGHDRRVGTRCVDGCALLDDRSHPTPGSLGSMDRYRVLPGTVVDLGEHDPNDASGFPEGKHAAKGRLRALNRRLEELQEVLYAQGRHKVLVVLQAMDTGGKDGTIRHVFDGVNPQGVKVASFKKPTDRELAHDYLWRVHRHTPGAGEITIFNRSHYEEVLVVRVHSLVPETVWSRRYDHINHFEGMLVDEGTTIVKFFLHISKEEQAERLQARLDTPNKQWKFAAGDLDERRLWDDYTAAFEDMLSTTSTDAAPWYIVPSDRKWYRNLVVSEIIVGALETLDLDYPPPEAGLESITIT